MLPLVRPTSRWLVASETDADGGVTSFGYDAVGDQTSETRSGRAGRPAGHHRVYDALDASPPSCPLSLPETARAGQGNSITAYSYASGEMLDTANYSYFPGDSVATLQGQSVPLADNVASFSNLPQAPGAERNYTV